MSETGMPSSLTEQEIRNAEARESQVIGDAPRLDPLEPHELSSELIDIVRRINTVASVLLSDAERRRRGPGNLVEQILSDPDSASASPELLAELVHLPEIERTLLRHAQLYSVHTDVGIHLHTRGALSRRDRELAVLRIAWLCQAPYEWGEHVMVAKRIGFTPEDIRRVIEGPQAGGLDPHDRAILKAVDELHDDAMISDATWAVLAERLDEQQLIELPIVVGHYQSTAYYQNSLRLRLHAGNAGLKAR